VKPDPIVVGIYGKPGEFGIGVSFPLGGSLKHRAIDIVFGKNVDPRKTLPESVLKTELVKGLLKALGKKILYG